MAIIPSFHTGTKAQVCVQGWGHVEDRGHIMCPQPLGTMVLLSPSVIMYRLQGYHPTQTNLILWCLMWQIPSSWVHMCTLYLGIDGRGRDRYLGQVYGLKWDWHGNFTQPGAADSSKYWKFYGEFSNVDNMHVTLCMMVHNHLEKANSILFHTFLGPILATIPYF